MILPVIAIMVGLACFFSAVAYWRKGALDYLIAGILWLVTAVGSLNVQVPYQVAVDNTVETGTQNFVSAEAMVAYVFILLGAVMAFNAMYLMFKKPKREDQL